MSDLKRDTAGNLWDSLNPAQRAAATFAGSGPLLVLAGPGSGKTLTITRRILFLLTEKAVLPEKILVITFTREAALSMRERFLRENYHREGCLRESDQRDNCRQENDLPQHILQSVNFGTFHSIFYQILRQSKGITERQTLSEADKKKLLLSALSVTVPEKSDQEKTYYVRELLAAISFLKNTGDHKRTAQKVPASFQSSFPLIYEEYERERNLQGKMDFDDMLLDCKELLSENNAVREYWQERFTHILIDEFQDINPVQYDVIRLLTGKQSSIFAVGDDDQAIYGFRGSSPECMQRFLEEYRAERILLDTNYRSCGEIVKASLMVIGDNKCRFSKELKTGREEGGGAKTEIMAEEAVKSETGKKVASEPVNRELPKVSTGGRVRSYGFMDRAEETAYLLKICREAKDCAVLFRTNRMLQRFAVKLRRAGIPYEMRERTRDPYLAEVALDIMAYLRLGAGERKPDLIHRIINKPSRYVDREALRGMKASSDPIDYLEEYYQSRRPAVTEHIRMLQKHLKAMKKMSPYLGLQYVRRVIGYDRWIQEKYGENPREREEAQEILDWLGEEAKEFQVLQDWIAEQREYRDRFGQKNGISAKVKLMTVHASKGLEFEHVILPDCNERIYPYGQMLEESEVEEERRIFYVGMTRAKDRLELLYLTGTRENPMQKTRFLNFI